MNHTILQINNFQINWSSRSLDEWEIVCGLRDATAPDSLTAKNNLILSPCYLLISKVHRSCFNFFARSGLRFEVGASHWTSHHHTLRHIITPDPFFLTAKSTNVIRLEIFWWSMNDIFTGLHPLHSMKLFFTWSCRLRLETWPMVSCGHDFTIWPGLIK